jgi:hypothetical protein
VRASRTLAAALTTALLPLLVVTGPARSDEPGPDQFLGYDGQVHDHAGWTVKGRHGTLYFGQDFDTACGYGPDLARYLKRLATVARIIERSGRRVLFSVGPNKLAVNKRDLRLSRLPHGECDRAGIEAQDLLMDRFADPNYLPIRKELLELDRSGTQVYWTMDSHWTTVGNTRWATAIAERLDPALAARQHFTHGRRTINPDVAYFQGDRETRETAPARLIRTQVKVRPVPGTDPYDVTLGTATDHAWTSKPSRLTWPGRTLLVGDSFTYVTLESLRPLFHRGRYLWPARVPDEEIVRGIRQADTVVLEALQRWLPVSPLVTRSFRRTLKAGLG